MLSAKYSYLRRIQKLTGYLEVSVSVTVKAILVRMMDHPGGRSTLECPLSQNDALRPHAKPVRLHHPSRLMQSSGQLLISLEAAL